MNERPKESKRYVKLCRGHQEVIAGAAYVCCPPGGRELFPVSKTGPPPPPPAPSTSFGFSGLDARIRVVQSPVTALRTSPRGTRPLTGEYGHLLS